MGDIFNVLLLQTTLRSATPVVLAAMGCLMTQHVNITNIGIDGMMLIGAFFAVLGSYFFGSWAAGLGLAILCGVLLGPGVDALRPLRPRLTALADLGFLVLLFCLLLVIGMSLWAIVYVKNKPIDLDIRGTYQNTVIPIGDYGGRPEGGYLIQLAAQNWNEEQSFSLYINSCLVDSGNWEELKPNLYRLTGKQCVLLVELHRDGSFYLQLPGLEEIILMNKLNDVPMYSGNQELWSDLKADYQKILTGE